MLILIIFIGVAQKALRLWCQGPSLKKKLYHIPYSKLPIHTNLFMRYI
jgi:hypothetical protein